MQLSRRFQNLFQQRRAEHDLHHEIELHIEQLTREAIAEGASESEARSAARRAFGSVDLVKENSRDTRGISSLNNMLQDFRYGLRALRTSPGFCASVILILALGIAATTAMFSVVDAVLLRPLHYNNSEQLVLMLNAPANRPNEFAGLSFRDFELYQSQNHAFSGMAANAFHNLTLTGAGEPAVVNAAAITPELFGILNARPLLGRLMTSADGRPGAPPVAIISETLWRKSFSADPRIIGRAIDFDMRPFTVAGVLPDGFRYPEGSPRQDVWISVLQDPLFGPLTSQPGVPLLAVLGRLKPGVALSTAQAEMSALSARLARQFPAEDTGFTIRLQSFRDAVTGDVRRPLLVLLAAVAVLFAMACANIAALLLSRNARRSAELGLRVTLGASRLRIVQQLLTESLSLAVLGGVIGALLATALIDVFPHWLPSSLLQIAPVPLSARSLEFAVALALGAALTFGAVPALLAHPTVKQTRTSTAASSTPVMQKAFVITEVALATVLLAGAGLLSRSFVAMTSVNPGFDPRNLTTAEISLPQFRFAKPEQWTAFANNVLADLQSQPGMQDVAIAAPLPMDSQGAASFAFSIVGANLDPRAKSPTADYATVSSNYFHVMRIPLQSGRYFTEHDTASTPNVAIISATLARRYFPNQNPIGRKMKFGFPPNGDTEREIVGVVGDIRDVALNRVPAPMMYVPFPQAPLYGGEVVVRSSLDTAVIAAAIQRAVHAIDKDVPVTNVDTLASMLRQTSTDQSFRAFLVSAFAFFGLTLAASGIFGIISQFASQRTKEFGIRMAIGANPADIFRIVIAQGGRLALIGLTIGIALALILTRLISGLLYQVSPTDVPTFSGIAVVLFAVAITASYLPARRVTQRDPMLTLRND